MTETNNKKEGLINSRFLEDHKKRQPSKAVRKVKVKQSLSTSEQEEHSKAEEVNEVAQQPTTVNSPEKKSTVASPFQKRERFEERHQRMTTYVRKDHHVKLNELKTTYRIPISEVINEALSEYFKKHAL